MPSQFRKLVLQIDLEDLDAWRARILSLLLLAGVVLGAIIALPSVLFSLSLGLWSVALVDLSALLFVIALRSNSSLTYRARAGIFCALIYVLGVALLLSVGVSSQSYLIAFPVMAALLLGLRPAVLALLLNAATLAAVGYLSSVQFPLAGIDGLSLLKWMVLTLNFSFVSAMLTASILVLFTGLERALARRRDSEERYRTLTEWTPAPLAVHDGKRFVYVNPAAIKLFGAESAQDLLGRQIFDVVHPDFRPVVQSRLKSHAREAGTLPLNEQKLLRLDGAIIHAEVQSARIVFDGVEAIQIAIHDITERKAAQEQVQQLAFSDPLTGLPNRRLFTDRLKQALTACGRHQLHGALVFVDLDDFRTINESLGQDMGDLLLQQVAARLSGCVRDGDTVARLGGDEFVVLLESLSKSTQEAATRAEAVCGKVLRSLNRPYQFGSIEHHASASIGITLIGQHITAADDPLMQAELAMYQAKEAGRSLYRFYDPQMQSVVAVRAAMEAALHEALTREQFFLQYQAQVTDQGRTLGAEALVRWLDPLRGVVSPADFIPLAEETDLILPLGQWVLESACTQLALWATKPEMAQLTVAVNVSVRQFQQNDFVARTMAVLERTGANPARLKLELTESLLVTAVDEVIAKMTALKGVGIDFALDDFGTGYSSLSILKRLPLDQLKIDQGFVRNILLDSNDAAIARMVLALADSVGLAVIAEGVETAEQRDVLAAMGCHAFQGYLFGRPMSVQDFQAFVRRP